MRRACSLFVLVLWGCPQSIVVYPDAGVEADGGSSGADAAERDSSAEAPTDAGPLDAGAGDGGADPCEGEPYCLTVEVEPPRVNVREAATIRALVENPGGADLSVRPCDAGPPRAIRAPNRPALSFDEIEHRLEGPGASDALSFTVDTVPPWFVATTFEIDVCLFEAGASVQRRTASVHVRGNVLFSAGYQGVFAVASDGRPAAGVANAYPQGLLLDDTITYAGALRVAADGSLLVLDPEARPARIARYALDGVDVRLGTFEHQMEQLAPVAPISYDNVAKYTIAQLPDGTVALADTHNSGTPDPRVLMWNPDGTFLREIRGSEPQHLWHSVAARSERELAVGMGYNIRGQVVRIDPQTGLELSGPPLTEDLRRYVFGLEPLPDGRLLLAGERIVMIVGDGGAAVSVSDIPNVDGRDWRAVTRFDDRLLVASDHQNDSGNIAVIEGRSFERWLRPEGSGGPVVVPLGLAYLE